MGNSTGIFPSLKRGFLVQTLAWTSFRLSQRTQEFDMLHDRKVIKKYGINQPHDLHPEDGQCLGQSSAPISTQLAKAEAAVATQQLMLSPRLQCRCDG